MRNEEQRKDANLRKYHSVKQQPFPETRTLRIRLQRTLLRSTPASKQLDLLGRLRSDEKAKSSYCETRCGKTQIRQRAFIYFDVSYSSKLLKTRQIRT